MIDLVALQMVLGVLNEWLGHREREVAYLIEGNRLWRPERRGTARAPSTGDPAFLSELVETAESV